MALKHSLLKMITQDQINFWIKSFGTFAILIPFFAGAISYNKLKRSYANFVLLLLIGFCVDVTGWLDYIRVIKLSDYLNDLKYAIYALLEVMFFLWFLFKLEHQKENIKSIIKVLFVLMPVLWVICYFISDTTFDKSPIFDCVSASLISFIAAFSLLHLAEEAADIQTVYQFWFLCAIFLYFFCSNFIFGLLQTQYGNKFWVVQCIVCIASYFIFTKGFIVLRKSLVNG